MSYQDKDVAAELEKGVKDAKIMMEYVQKTYYTLRRAWTAACIQKGETLEAVREREDKMAEEALKLVYPQGE